MVIKRVNTGDAGLGDEALFHQPLMSADQMRRTDAAAIGKTGIPGAVLMERAGLGVAEFLLKHFCGHHCFVILAGKGNNGGDGFVVARLLIQAGADVKVFAVAPAAEYQGDALINLKILGNLEARVIHAPGAVRLGQALASDCVIVDAIFGTGFSNEPRGKASLFIKAAAEAAEGFGQPVVAVDIASGVDASTGEVARTTLPADVTVTFHLPKIGHFVEPGSYFCGDLVLADIGIPSSDSMPVDHFLITQEAVAELLPGKNEFDHKFSTGRVIVAGGSTGLTGAACMAAQSALRAGAGVVTCAVPASLNQIFEQKLLEVMSLPLADTGDGNLSEAALDQLLNASRSADCLVLGPGLGRRHESRQLALNFLKQADVPVVLDADGLNAVAGQLGQLKKRRAATVLTPHTGELGRLLGMPADEIFMHRLAHSKEAARKSGSVVVLKGSSTIITDGRMTLINSTGNPGLATAGSGDVLSGIIAALISKEMDPLQAAAAGVWLHGRAADLAAADLCPDNLIASDLIEYLPMAFASLFEEPEQEEGAR